MQEITLGDLYTKMGMGREAANNAWAYIPGKGMSVAINHKEAFKQLTGRIVPLGEDYVNGYWWKDKVDDKIYMGIYKRPKLKITDELVADLRSALYDAIKKTPDRVVLIDQELFTESGYYTSEGKVKLDVVISAVENGVNEDIVVDQLLGE
jgi:hypothetical protein